MKLDERSRIRAARSFAERWAGRGYEKGDTASFWLELLRDVVGMVDVTTNVRFEQSTAERGYIDVVIPDARTMIEQKSLGVDLDKPELRQGIAVTPFEQAKRYADSLPNSQRPDTIIVCDFDHFRIHDLDHLAPADTYAEFRLEELPKQLHLLDFLVDPQAARREREERVSLNAGRLIGKVYDMLREQYADPDSEQSRHSLNVLCGRLVFCLVAEDAGLFPKDAFYKFLHGMPARMARIALRELFEHLRTPTGQRGPYASDELKAFPYVNGGLFADEGIVIPQFTEQIREDLLTEASAGFDWKDISPTIFGAAFESTLNPDARRSGGMHYTSVENIHKVIDPLFLDDLKAELSAIEGEKVEKTRKTKLRIFQKKLSELTFLDPAAGSHNFLTETYISLRKLELRVIEDLQGDQSSILGDAIMVSIGQFYAIEINDFAVSVGKTALWIAEQQMMERTQELLPYREFDFLPLKGIANSVCGNALRIDWNDVLPAG